MNTRVTRDRFMLLLNENKSIEIPNALLPSTIHNENNYIISLGDLCVWMGEYATALGVDIFPGTAGANVHFKRYFSLKYHVKTRIPCVNLTNTNLSSLDRIKNT